MFNQECKMLEKHYFPLLYKRGYWAEIFPNEEENAPYVRIKRMGKGNHREFYVSFWKAETWLEGFLAGRFTR